MKILHPFLCAILCAFGGFAQAQPYPSKPVKLVVGLVALLSVGTVAGFVLALRGVSTEPRHDVGVDGVGHRGLRVLEGGAVPRTRRGKDRRGGAEGKVRRI